MFAVLFYVEIVIQGRAAFVGSQAGGQAQCCFAGQTGDTGEQVSSHSMGDRSQDAGERQCPSPQGRKGLHEGVSGEGVRQVAVEQAGDGSALTLQSLLGDGDLFRLSHGSHEVGSFDGGLAGIAQMSQVGDDLAQQG